ncbi:uncharacterized protein LOC109852102 isoform X2 [Pseudomyrmex gracilis]|uniref:uncharacterized protein LOC109852102 isoform X2 n=1 Tax=Pseudomyrmex gracilis TaxID=219809 RepID=UPI0009955E41|nr:uncharacterized protein LOC109852102 isoform X2 [Pseudomyrmex gracilis]
MLCILIDSVKYQKYTKMTENTCDCDTNRKCAKHESIQSTELSYGRPKNETASKNLQEDKTNRSENEANLLIDDSEEVTCNVKLKKDNVDENSIQTDVSCSLNTEVGMCNIKTEKDDVDENSIKTDMNYALNTEVGMCNIKTEEDDVDENSIKTDINYALSTEVEMCNIKTKKDDVDENSIKTDINYALSTEVEMCNIKTEKDDVDENSIKTDVNYVLNTDIDLDTSDFDEKSKIEKKQSNECNSDTDTVTDTGDSSGEEEKEMNTPISTSAFVKIKPKPIDYSVRVRMVFLDNLPLKTDEKFIQGIFKCCEDIKYKQIEIHTIKKYYGRIVKPSLGRKTIKVATITFSTLDAAQKAVNMNPLWINEHYVNIHFFDDTFINPETFQTNRVFLQNVPHDMTSETLCNIFGDCGVPLYIRYLHKAVTEEFTGIVYIQFQTDEAVRCALQKTNRYYFDGVCLTVTQDLSPELIENITTSLGFYTSFQGLRAVVQNEL